MAGARRGAILLEGEKDPERLSRAFIALEATGITARENFACCRTCGQAEIAAAGSPDARGYVYFHSQCTDSAAVGHGLALLYGGFDGSSDTTASIGREIVAALQETGLSVEWNGDPEQTITIAPSTGANASSAEARPAVKITIGDVESWARPRVRSGHTSPAMRPKTQVSPAPP